MRRIIVMLCAAGYLSLMTGAVSAAQGVCNCDDMAQIQRRIDEAGAGIRAYSDEYERTPAVMPNTVYNHNFLQNRIQSELGTLTQTSLEQFFSQPSPSYTSGPPDCAVHFPENDLTNCIHEALSVHEAVHVSGCKAKWPYYLLRSFEKEELDAYVAERSFLIQQRDRLMCTCPYYALRVSGVGTTNVQIPYESVTGQGGMNGASSKPGIEVPLKIQGAHVSGEGSGTLNNQVAGAGLAQCSISSGTPVKLSVDGELSRPPVKSLHVEISGKPDKEKTQGLCTIPGKTVQIDDTSSTRSVTFPEDISGLDTPANFTMPLAPGISWVMSSELVVKDPWPQTKASNGRGSTVGDALREIGMPDCTQ